MSVRYLYLYDALKLVLLLGSLAGTFASISTTNVRKTASNVMAVDDLNKLVSIKGLVDEMDLEEMADDLLEHYEEDLPILDIKSMTPNEVTFHFFRNHDYDRSQKLDGLELYKALIHDHRSKKVQMGDDEPGSHKHNPERVIETIDAMLEVHDLNGDGLLSYPEFQLQVHVGRVANDELLDEDDDEEDT